MNIYLIGFMGTGKSLVSYNLSQLLKMNVVEMDDTLEKEQGKTITQIFEDDGEEQFRLLETELLERTKNQNCIVSCGGGVVVKQINVDIMKENGKIVLLTATPETIYNRVKDNSSRPLLNGNMNVEFIAQLMGKRKQQYLSTADIVIETDDKAIEDICQEIKDKVGINEKE